MSPKRQVNHNIRKHFNTIIYNISRYAEIALSMVILLVIALAGFRLIMEVADTSVMSMDTEIFQHFPFSGFVSGSRRGICKNALPAFRTDSC